MFRNMLVSGVHNRGSDLSAPVLNWSLCLLLNIPVHEELGDILGEVLG